MFNASLIAALAMGAFPEPDTTREPRTDSARSPNCFLPAFEIVGANLAFSAYNRYVRDVDYARIDMETIGHNLTHGWGWDDNNFEVNQIGHPTQGGMYYSIARANGHGYLWGLAYTTLGSVQWEYFMETEPPSLNDLVTTRMGGAMIGEVSWRLAEYVSGESTGRNTGWLGKSGAFLVNPVFGVDRLLNGAPVRTTTRHPKLMGLRISTGRALGKGLTHATGTVNEPSAQVPLASTNIRLVHGDPFEAERPFDHFSLNLGISVISNPVANVSLRGQLWKTDIAETDWSRHVLGIAQNYDFINSSIYRLSANSMGVEWISELRMGDDWRLGARVQPVFIALGAASTEYYLNVERDYNLGLGGGWKTAISVRKSRAWLFTAFSDRYWIHTQSGAAGEEVIDIHSVEVQRDVYKGLGVGLSYHLYDRYGYYRDHPDVGIVNQEFRANVTVTL